MAEAVAMLNGAELSRAIRPLQWLHEHRAQLKGQVYGPMALEMHFGSPLALTVFHAAAGRNWADAFLFTENSDRDLLLRVRAVGVILTYVFACVCHFHICYVAQPSVCVQAMEQFRNPVTTLVLNERYASRLTAPSEEAVRYCLLLSHVLLELVC